MIEQFDGPANLIAYATDRTYRGLVCGITIHKSHINLMLARGASFVDPHNLLQGSGKIARHIKITRMEDIHAPGVREVLEFASRP